MTVAEKEVLQHEEEEVAQNEGMEVVQNEEEVVVQAGCAEVCEDEGTAVDLKRASVGQEEGHITTIDLDYQQA